MNVHQAAITSVVADRVPVSARGRASAAVGLGLPFGSTLGAPLGAAFSEQVPHGYLVFGPMAAGAAVLFTSCTHEVPAGPVVPSLVQLADPSFLIPPERATLLRQRGFEVRPVPGAGHTIHRDDLEAFMASLEGWV